MEILIQTITAILFILFASFAEGIEWKERYLALTYTERERLNKLWHWLQFFERVFAIAFGFSVGLFSGLSWLTLKIIFITAVVFWIIYDIVINYYASRDLFRPSKTTTSFSEKFYILKPVLLVAALILLLTGCGGHRVVETVRVDTIKAVSPTIEEFLDAGVITDTIIIANKIVEKDTVIDVRYYPVEEKFYIKVKPDTVTITRIDTVARVEVVEEKSSGTFTWIIITALAVIALIMLIVIKK